MKQTKKRLAGTGRTQAGGAPGRGRAMDVVVAAGQVVTVLCLVKGNPAWRGTLSLLFFGCAAALFDRGRESEQRAWRLVGAAFSAVGAGLLVWFGVTG